MPLICYVPKKFSSERLDLIAKVNLICKEYEKQGYGLTLRGLYYQMFSRHYLPENSTAQYKRLGTLVADARLAGLIDWYSLQDLTRGSKAIEHWNTPSQIVEAALDTYAIDRWRNQEHYCEVWVEKEGLEQIVGSACNPLDVRYFACRGYTSHPALWEAAQRLLNKIDQGKKVHVIHLGDHDPSGIDMSRNIYEMLSMFTYQKVHVQRIALNMGQIQKYNLPPDPAKQTDSRFAEYERKYGPHSWELDAVEPSELVRLITKAINQFRDEKQWAEALKEEEKGKNTIKYICQYWQKIILFIRDLRTKDTSPVVCQDCGATQDNPKCMCGGAKEIKGALV